MTGNDILNKALSLLGFFDSNGNSQLTQRIMQKALGIINFVYIDLMRICGIESEPLESLNKKVNLSQYAIEVLVCGVASYIADTEGDDNAQALWSAEYQARRTTLSSIQQYKDVLPNAEY